MSELSLRYKKKRNILSLGLAIILLLSTFLTIPGNFADPIASTPVGVNGRILSANMAGDTSDWIEIATCGDYSLIVRKDVLPIGGMAYDSQSNHYPISDARTQVNNWFKNTLNSNARLRDFTSTNDAISNLGYHGLIDYGISKPTGAMAKTGDDVAFLLSFAEAARFCSTQYFDSIAQTFKQSSSTAYNNFYKLNVAPVDQHEREGKWWLRSPGSAHAREASVVEKGGFVIWGIPYERGTVNQYNIANYWVKIRPALWVNSNIFGSNDVGYVVHYYLLGTTAQVISDKVVPGQMLGSFVTEYAVDVLGYSAVAPTSIGKFLAASGNEFVFYYTPTCPTVEYTVHYYLSGTTTNVAQNKTVTSQTLGALVTEYAISIPGYTASAPTSLTKTLTASANDFVFYYTANCIGNDPTGVDGRILPPSLSGDSVNWIEIARYGDYSLIVRTNYINIYTSHYGDPAWQYTPFGQSTAYGSSTVRGYINAWFNGAANSAADNLPANARLRSYTMQNNAASVLGTGSTIASLTNGFSQPSPNQVGAGTDVAFVLSYGEVAAFLSKQHFVRDLIPQTQTSNNIAITNYGKITIPQVNCYGMWLRSPGDFSNTVGALEYTGRDYQFYTSSTGYSQYGLVYPALWVNSSIFDVEYTVHYYLAETATKLAADKIVTGQTMGSYVTETAIDVPGYIANASSISKPLSASGNEFVFYYNARCDLSYVVNYLERGSGRPLATQKVVGDQVFGTSVT
ncbi:MAG: DUF6273 domain-containing protein, partial [Nitrososphaerota archaeon]|nr:DUF6273 domain-containing protein [Nitrososphaerota archaeon]